MTRIAALFAAVPEIQHVDLNPVIVGPSGCVTVDARIGLSTPPSPIIPTRALRGSRCRTSAAVGRSGRGLMPHS